MKIVVNGAGVRPPRAELSGVLGELGYGDAVVSTAVNGEFVAASVRAHTELSDGDRVEVLAPMQGG